MIFVIKGADFSESNIGKVDVNLSFSNETRQILNNYGVTVDEEDLFQVEFNKFVIKLASAGLLGNDGKIKSLCLPFMAKYKQSNAYINALNGGNFFTEDVSSSLQFIENGLRPVEGKPIALADISFANMTDGYHLLAYNSTEETREGANKTIFGFLGTIIAVYKQDDGIPSMQLNSGGVKLTSSEWEEYSSSCCVIAANLFSEKKVFYVNGKTKESVIDYISNTPNNPKLFQYSGTTYTNGTGNACMSKASWGVLSAGLPLTNEETLLFDKAIKSLMVSVESLL